MRSFQPLRATERALQVQPGEQQVSLPEEPQPAGLEEPEERLLAQALAAQQEQLELRTVGQEPERVQPEEPTEPALLEPRTEPVEYRIPVSADLNRHPDQQA